MTDDRVLWSLENAGMLVALDPTRPLDYLRFAGASGLGVAPTTVQIDGNVTSGGRFRRSKREPRQVVMPVATFGRDRSDVEDKLRYLVRLLQDDFTSPKLVARYPNGSTFDTEVHYTGGADHTWGSSDTDGRTFCKWILQLTSPDAYFTSRAVQQFPVVAPAGRGLLKGGSLSKLKLSSSQALGTINVNNAGDVESWPTWRVNGPATELVVIRKRDGATLHYKGNVTASDTIIVDARNKTIVNQAGDNLYDGLIGAPRFFTIPPGQSSIDVAVANTTADSKAILSFPERRELIF